MKHLHTVLSVLVAAVLCFSCEKKDYPAGLPEYEHHYYMVYVPNNNTTRVIANRNESNLIKLPVQFYSTFTRTYDAIGHYSVVTTGINNPAADGVDFQIVDKLGTPLQMQNNMYQMVFPKAQEVKDTIYLKLLNNPTPGTRIAEIHLIENKTDLFYVDIFSTAFRRIIEIR